MAESKWMRRIERGLGELAVRAHRRPVQVLAVTAVITALALVASSQLRVTADLEQLLPKTFDSVKGLEPLKERFGGIGYIVVVGMDAEPEQLRAFADEYVPKLEKMEGIRYVDFKRSTKFFEERSLYYLDLPDLEEIARRIKDREKYERRQLNPMFVKLDDEAPPSLDFSDIEAKYGRRSDQRLAGTGEEYYLDPDKKMVVILAKPSHIASDLTFSEKMVGQVEDYFAKEDLKRFGPSFRVGMTGAFKYKVEQQKQISADMAWSSMAAMIILLVYLAFHFRSFLAVLLITLPVSVGLAWTYGITFFTFGSLNVVTGFLGAVLGGLGFEHGIHLLSRYRVLRSQGVGSEEAVRESFRHTGGSALVSAVVASLTFLALAYSEFRAFREFGVIAAIGMFVVLAAYFPVMPALIGIANRLRWKPRPVALSGSELSRLLPRFPRGFALGVGLMLAAFFYNIPDSRFDFDFHSLEDSSLETFKLDHETNLILGYSQEPVVILTDKTESERALVKALKTRQQQQGAASTIDFVAALDDLVPQQQTEKRGVLDTIGTTLAKVRADRLDPETRPRFEKLQRWVNAQPFVRADIPIAVRRQFEGVSGAQGGFVLIFPSIKLSDGLAVRSFAKEVRGIELPGGERFSAAGEAMILADVLEMVIREGPIVVAAAVLLVLAAMWITLGSLRVALVCMSPTVLSLLGMAGLMAIIDQPFNYLNIMAVPILIGTTVDAGVHLVSRLSDAAGNFPAVFAETGRAIVGGLITSAVGFGAMNTADHPGLNSLGAIANLGFAANLIVMLVGFPALLLLLQRGPLARYFLPPPEETESAPARAVE